MVCGKPLFGRGGDNNNKKHHLPTTKAVVLIKLWVSVDGIRDTLMKEHLDNDWQYSIFLKFTSLVDLILVVTVFLLVAVT